MRDEFGTVGRGVERAVGREQGGVELLGELDVEPIDQPQGGAARPGAGEEIRQRLPFDGGGGQRVEALGDLLVVELAGPVKAAKGRQHLGVEVGRGVQLLAAKPEPNQDAYVVAEEKIYKG